MSKGPFPTSTFLRKGLRSAPDSEQISVNKQIEQLRARYFYLEARYQGLVSAFQMLRPLLRNKTLQKRLINGGKQRSTSLVSTALFEACVLDCYTILIDSKENNPSLRTLVRPFLTKNRRKDPRLSDELARIYSDRSPCWPDAAVVGIFSAEDQRALIANKEKANAERRLAFERMLNRLARDWARLERASQHFPVFRTHFIAHSILERDAATERYAYPQMPKPNELCATIEKILPIVTRSIATLAFILGVGAERIGEFAQRAKEDAAIFWDLKNTIIDRGQSGGTL